MVDCMLHILKYKNSNNNFLQTTTILKCIHNSSIFFYTFVSNEDIISLKISTYFTQKTYDIVVKLF